MDDVELASRGDRRPYRVFAYIELIAAMDRNRLLRRVRVHPAEDYEAWFSSPEDIILKKMDFYREGESEKHLRDIASVMKIRGEKIDRAYVTQWATTLGLQDIWNEILRRVDK